MPSEAATINAHTDEKVVKIVSAVDWNFTTCRTDFLTHNFHPYPAKFIPQIPGTLIEAFSREGDTILDPFCGSGTTLVEAVRRGRNAIGVDANPLATLIARVKCRPLSSSERLLIQRTARESERAISELYGHHTQKSQLALFDRHPRIPDIPDLAFWFPKPAIDELALIKESIDLCESEVAREFLQVALSSIIVNVSHQDSDTRYTRREKGLRECDTLKKWMTKVNDMLDRISQLDAPHRMGTVRTVTMDSRQLSGIEDASVALAITSPPYPNAYSYHLYHRYRMLWLGFDQPRFKQEEIGSHRKYSAKQNGASAGTFLAEMTDVLRAVAGILKPAALCVFVVGDSIIRGEIVRNDDIVRKAAQASGLSHLTTVRRRIHTARKAFNPTIGKIDHENLVFLRRQ